MDWVSILIFFALSGYAIAISAAYLLLIWFDDAKFFVEYGKIFNLRKFLPHFDKFLQAQEQGSSDSYLDFVSVVKDNFATRLVTCEKCLAFWLVAAQVLAICIMLLLSGYSDVLILTPFIPTYIFGVSYLALLSLKKLK